MTFKQSLTFRHACKIFDENKKISDDDFKDILEAGRLAPSSFGLEHWEFWLVQNNDFRQKIRKACWNQVQITSCSHLLIIFAKISDFKKGSKYIKDMFLRRFANDKAQHEAYIEKFDNFLLKNIGQSDIEIFAWSKAQCFLTAANMMNAAACLGIDTCAIEGFDENELNEVLKINPSEKRVAMLLPFGYRINEPKSKIRKNLDEFLKIF